MATNRPGPARAGSSQSAPLLIFGALAAGVGAWFVLKPATPPGGGTIVAVGAPTIS